MSLAAGDDPYEALRASIEQVLKEQVPDSRLNEFVVLSKPEWLTGAIPSEKDSTQAILVRSAVAFEFSLSVESQECRIGCPACLRGAAVNLNQPGQYGHRVWMDLGGTLANFGSGREMKKRVYFA